VPGLGLLLASLPIFNSSPSNDLRNNVKASNIYHIRVHGSTDYYFAHVNMVPAILYTSTLSELAGSARSPAKFIQVASCPSSVKSGCSPDDIVQPSSTRWQSFNLCMLFIGRAIRYCASPAADAYGLPRRHTPAGYPRTSNPLEATPRASSSTSDRRNNMTFFLTFDASQWLSAFIADHDNDV
jgi:hypothetical protein